MDTKKALTVSDYAHNKAFVQKLEDTLGARAQQFITSVLSLSNSDPKLRGCDPVKLFNTCLLAASINLPVNQNLGFAYVIKYKDDIQLQLGWKGFIQLAQRSGQYKTIHCTDVREGEIIENNRLTGEISFLWMDDSIRNSAKVIGYVAYFELLNGYSQTLYMSMKEIESHAKKYSQTYAKGFGVWKDNFDAMARKTVVKQILSKFGPLSVDMQKAIEYDQANSEGKYPDNDSTVEIVEAKIGSSEEERSKEDA